MLNSYPKVWLFENPLYLERRWNQPSACGCICRAFEKYNKIRGFVKIEGLRTPFDRSESAYPDKQKRLPLSRQALLRRSG
jgi:hypothetical protein